MGIPFIRSILRVLTALQPATQKGSCILPFQSVHKTVDEVAEWLRRWTANPMCSARVGSNPILVDTFFSLLHMLGHLWRKVKKVGAYVCCSSPPAPLHLNNINLHLLCSLLFSHHLFSL